MISKKYIKELGFNNIYDFFHYVIESKINGNYSQTKKFVNNMSKEQFKYFLLYLKEWGNHYEGFDEELMYMRMGL